MMRLVRAQGEMVKSLEARLAQQERKAAELTAARAELDRIASSGPVNGLIFLPSLLRSLAAAEAELSGALMLLDDIRRELIAAKSRHKALTTRTSHLRDAWERKIGEDDALETALHMSAKASGKHDVVI